MGLEIPPFVRTPQSAPRYVWALYVVAVLLEIVIAMRGGWFGVVAIFTTVFFSFQFWSYVTWRGLKRYLENDEV